MRPALSGAMFAALPKEAVPSLERAVAMVKETGCQGLELTGTLLEPRDPIETIEDGCDLLEEERVTVAGLAHEPECADRASLEEVKLHIDFADHVSTRLMLIQGDPKWIRKACEHADESRVRLAIHVGPGAVCPDVDQAMHFADKVGHPRFGIAADLPGLAGADKDAMEALAGRLRKRLLQVRVAAPPGAEVEARAALAGLAEALYAEGYDDFIVLNRQATSLEDAASMARLFSGALLDALA